LFFYQYIDFFYLGTGLILVEAAPHSWLSVRWPSTQ